MSALTVLVQIQNILKYTCMPFLSPWHQILVSIACDVCCLLAPNLDTSNMDKPTGNTATLLQWGFLFIWFIRNSFWGVCWLWSRGWELYDTQNLHPKLQLAEIRLHGSIIVPSLHRKSGAVTMSLFKFATSKSAWNSAAFSDTKSAEEAQCLFLGLQWTLHLFDCVYNFSNDGDL